MLLPGAKAPTFRQCSGVCCRVWVISPLSGPSHIAYAAWSGRFFIRESATSSKASNPNQSSSSIVPNPWRNNFVNLATTSRSLLPTELRHKTPDLTPGGGDFRRSFPLFARNHVLDPKTLPTSRLPRIDGLPGALNIDRTGFANALPRKRSCSRQGLLR